MKAPKKIPLRQCVGCREMKEKKELIRVLRTDTGELCIDQTGRRNGRGAYLCRGRECFLKARKNHGLERSLKIQIPVEVYDQLAKELENLGE